METLIPKSAEDTFPLGIDLQDDQDSEQYDDIDDINDTFLGGDTLEGEGLSADMGTGIGENQP